MSTTKKTELDELDAVIEEEITEKPKKATSVKKTPRKYAPDERIECRSVTGGELFLVGPKSKLLYTWEDYNDTTEVEYQDLQALQSRKSGFLVKPRFIIEDEELVEQWGAMLKPVYDKITTQTIEEFFELPINKFKAQLQVMPAGLKDAIKTKAVQMIHNEELYDIRKVREMDAAWGTDFVAMFMK
jgi:hypothetical protein